MKHTAPDHEKIFDEICGKLNELSHRGDGQGDDPWSNKIEKMQTQLKKSQDELKAAQSQIQEKIKTLDSVPVPTNDTHQELKRIADQLEVERTNNSKISSDLAKSLELNLKLQFEIEEVKSKSNQVINEERKHNQYLSDKNKGLSSELELAQALNGEMRAELEKAKNKFQEESELWLLEKSDLEQAMADHKSLIEQQNSKLKEVEALLEQKQQEIQKITESLSEFEDHSLQQNDAMKNLSEVAEKKIIELKMALDRKALESQDYYGHLQQSLAQAAILKQENAALKDYIAKISSLQNQLQAKAQENRQQQEVRA